MVMLIFWIVVTLVLSGFFSGSEMAFVSANKLGIEVLRNKGHERGRYLARFYEKPKEFLGTMLVGNNIVLVIFTILMTQLFQPILGPYLGEDSASFLIVVTLIITIVVLIFGEYIPKTIFRLYSNELLYRLSLPLRFFKWILAVPTWFMITLSNFLLKYLLRAPVDRADQVLTRVDLEHYIQDSISEEETIDKEILTNALNLNQVKVRDCMIPRMDIIHIDKQANVDDLKDTFVSSFLSRIMVIDGDIENIIGYIHHQKLITDANRPLEKLIMPVTYIPEAMNVQDLMMKFINDGSSIAVVVDEFGGTAGLITLEDILEEIFGEIEDEHDEDAIIDVQLSDTEYRFSGRTEVSFINEKYNLNLPDGEYHTLSGYIVMTNQSIPDEGDHIELEGRTFIMESVTDKRIEIIRMIVPPSKEEEDYEA